MISRILLLVLSFIKKETFKKFMEIFQQYANISPNVFNALYCKFRLVRLCPFFADAVTNNSQLSCNDHVSGILIQAATFYHSLCPSERPDNAFDLSPLSYLVEECWLTRSLQVSRSTLFHVMHIKLVLNR